MKFREWLEELEYDVISGDLDIEVEDVIYDSRKAREHVVFVCTKGTKVDSHEFIPEVVKAGVRVLVVERQADIPAGVTAIRVHSSREALALLSAARFRLSAGEDDHHRGDRDEREDDNDPYDKGDSGKLWEEGGHDRHDRYCDRQ